MKRGSALLPLVFLLAATPPSSVPQSASQIHVFPNAGETIQPITAAVTKAKPGDTIVVHAGTYVGVLSIAKPGTSTQRFTLKSAGDGVATLQANLSATSCSATSPPVNRAIAIGNGADFWTIQGLTIVGGISVKGTNTGSLEAHVRNRRVPALLIKDVLFYEYFAGFDPLDQPVWTTDLSQAQPVMSDPNGCAVPTVVYHAVLDRYLATTSHGDPVGKLSIFDAPEPWGPWTTVAYYNNWAGFGTTESLFYTLPSKWISADGNTVWIVFSSVGLLDAFNLVKGTLTLKSPS